jgi:RNA polymerase II subunit A-like phosphatase
MSQLYEMHVYTMGTRSYADAICKVIDPDGKIFGHRILSRDESGSMSSKSLQRLFPTDQSMVVIIDDRADVWANSPNLVKVVPYDFFVGIGDINGAFLPPPSTALGSPTAPGTPSSAASSPAPTTPADIPSQEEGLLLQSKLLDELAEKRPLAKLEEESDREDDEEADTSAKEDGNGKTEDEQPGATTSEVKPSSAEPAADGATENAKEKTTKPAPNGTVAKPATPPHHHPHLHHRKQLLNPNDYELNRVAKVCLSLPDSRLPLLTV